MRGRPIHFHGMGNMTPREKTIFLDAIGNMISDANQIAAEFTFDWLPDRDLLGTFECNLGVVLAGVRKMRGEAEGTGGEK
jgi:hypothetical protein